MFFLEHLICNIKQGADILAGCMVLRGHAPDVCIKKILNFGHCRNITESDGSRIFRLGVIYVSKPVKITKNIHILKAWIKSNVAHFI